MSEVHRINTREREQQQKVISFFEQAYREVSIFQETVVNASFYRIERQEQGLLFLYSYDGRGYKKIARAEFDLQGRLREVQLQGQTHQLWCFRTAHGADQDPALLARVADFVDWFPV